jgi:hypothetical protein
MSPKVTSPLLAAKSTDEFAPLPLSPAVSAAAEQFGERMAALAPRLGLTESEHAFDRRGTATALRAPHSPVTHRSLTCRPTSSTRPVGTGPARRD